MCRERCWRFVVIFVVCSVDSSRSENFEPAVLIDESARFVPPPPPFAPPLLFPTNSATGILVAIAVPVPVPDLNVFVSYNFEANYNMPNQPTDAIAGPLNRLKLNPAPDTVDPAAGGSVDDVIARRIDGELEFDDTTTEFSEEISRVARSVSEDKIVFTRRGAYRLIESRLKASGIEGRACLLLAICETAKFPLLEGNGVVGHVLHVILTPSSSMSEDLPSDYSRAEAFGLSGDCSNYEQKCNFNFLNAFSTIL